MTTPASDPPIPEQSGQPASDDPSSLEGTDEDWRQLAACVTVFLFPAAGSHPFLFGDETHSACGNVSPVRDSMEIRLLKAAMELEKAHFRYLPGHTAFKCGSWRNHLPGYPKPDGADLSSGPQAALLLYRAVSSCGYKKREAFCQRLPAAWSVFLSTASIIRPLRMLLRALYL